MALAFCTTALISFKLGGLLLNSSPGAAGHIYIYIWIYVHRFSHGHFINKEFNCVLSSSKGNGKCGSKCHLKLQGVEHVDSQTADGRFTLFVFRHGVSSLFISLDLSLTISVISFVLIPLSPDPESVQTYTCEAVSDLGRKAGTTLTAEFACKKR